MPDIVEMLKAIAAKGLSQAAIGAKLGVTQPTVWRLLQGGVKTDYETGKKIEALFNELCPDSPEPLRDSA